MAERLTYRTRNHYNTVSNKQRKVRTPGNRLVFIRERKVAGQHHCALSGAVLNGLPNVRRVVLSRLPRHKRTVARPYGGHFSHKVVRDRILRAFLFEEKRCVAAVLAEKQRAAKKQNKTKKN